MASADSNRNLSTSLFPYLKRHKKTQYYSLYLHPDNEDREVSAQGLTPSGSLLTWIDDMFTTPETILDRTAGRWDNIKLVQHQLPSDISARMHFKIFGIDNRCEPQTHGQFDDFRYWNFKYKWRGKWNAKEQCEIVPDD
jgi:hypothetical protein